MDLSNSVILPREDFIELQQVAWDSTPAAVKTRVAQTIQSTTTMVGAAAIFVGATWGWVKAMDWLDGRRTANKIYEAETIAAARLK